MSNLVIERYSSLNGIAKVVFIGEEFEAIKKFDEMGEKLSSYGMEEQECDCGIQEIRRAVFSGELDGKYIEISLTLRRRYRGEEIDD